MNQQNYNCNITANITTQEAIKNINHVWDWWATNFEGSAEKLNDIFTVRLEETFVIFKVIEISGNDKIVWQVTDCNLHWLKDKKEWKDTRIEWEISTKGNLTTIHFTHIGLVPEIECYQDCRKGWTFYITKSLLQLITEGKGLPETPKAVR